MTYRVRVDLQGAKPPVWRRLELASDLRLSQVHELLQAAFGWLDCHLHRFALGSSVWDLDSSLYLCPFDVDEGEDDDGLDAREVRLDEVLVGPGDELLYVYDYGDGWEHVIRLESVLPIDEAAPRARCVAGRRPGPPEDCGGVWGFEELVAAGEDLGEFDLEEVDDAVQAALTEGSAHAGGSALAGSPLLVPGSPPLVAGWPPVVAVLAARLGRSAVAPGFESLVTAADLGAPVEPDAELAAAMGRRYVWLMNRVGADGIKLTAAGYLPPVHVEAAMNQLGLDRQWIGKGNREDGTYPVLALRESAQALGLLRKANGRLTVTAAGRKLARDPMAMWRQLASRMPLEAVGSFGREVTVLTLVWVATGRALRTELYRQYLEECVGALGWRSRDGEPPPGWSLSRTAARAIGVLEQANGFEPGWPVGEGQQPTEGGQLLARAALGREG